VSSSRPQRRFAVAAVLMSLGFTVALLEALPRLAPGLMPEKVRAVERIYDARESWENMMHPDRQLGFSLKPGLDIAFPSEAGQIAVKTLDAGIDSVGYRDLGTKAPFDAMAIGDSFTFCDDCPAESCWVKLLSQQTGLSIGDLGVNGYSNLAEANMLTKVGPVWKPKLVLLGFFPNDFKDNVHFNNWVRSDSDDYWTWMRRKRRSDTSDWLARNSFLYRLFDASRRYGDRKPVEYNGNGVSLVLRSDDWWWGVVERSEVTPTYAITQQALASADAIAKKQGSHLVVLLFPFKEEVYWDVVRQHLKHGADLSDDDVDAPLSTLGDFMSKQSIDYCNLTAPLREHARKGEQLYLKTSAHWTAAGNKVAADAILACLREKGLLASPS
jgi:hypothetical protein